MNQKLEDEEKKSPKELRQEHRESIEVVKSEHDMTTDDEEEKPKEETEEKEDEVEAKKEEPEEKKDNKETKEDDEDEVTEEDDPVKLKKAIERLKRRIGTKTNAEKTLKDQLADAQAKLKAVEDANGEKVLTEEDVETRAEQKAKLKREQENLDAAFDRLEKGGKEVDKNFPDKVTELGQDYGLIPIHMIEILDDLERGGAVLNYLCDNPDEYEEIRKLRPGKMATKLNALDDKVKPKKPVKEISKVPKPNEPVKPQSTPNDTVLTGKESMEDFMRKRQAMREKRRTARGY